MYVEVLLLSSRDRERAIGREGEAGSASKIRKRHLLLPIKPVAAEPECSSLLPRLELLLTRELD